MFDSLNKPIRIIVAGAKGCGKTSMLTVLSYGIETFSQTHFPTIEDLYYFNNENIQLFDMAGVVQNEATIPKHFYSNADGFLLVYDATDEQSFTIMESLKHFIDKLRDKVPIVCMGTKSDLFDSKTVNFDIVNVWAQAEKVKLFEVSAKNRKSLIEPVLFLLSRINTNAKSFFSRNKRV